MKYADIERGKWYFVRVVQSGVKKVSPERAKDGRGGIGFPRCTSARCMLCVDKRSNSKIVFQYDTLTYEMIDGGYFVKSPKRVIKKTKLVEVGSKDVVRPVPDESHDRAKLPEPTPPSKNTVTIIEEAMFA